MSAATHPPPHYIIIGAGLSGCVVASRLSLANNSVLLLESAPTPKSPDPAVLPSTSAFTLALTNPDLLYQYTSTPQPALNNRCVGIQAGHTLGGGSAVNYAAWTRGHRTDYDAWAKLVGDARWSYDALLPYFKASENYSACEGAVKEQHGFDGPVKLCSGPRGYPLREVAREAMLAGASGAGGGTGEGLKWNPDMNSGNPNGVAPLIESWERGIRQYAGKDYDLSHVEIRGGAQVAHVLIENGKAVGVQLVSGEQIRAGKEVILAAGAVRTPQVLMLSGIGPEAELGRVGVRSVLDLPVGQGLWDHAGTHLNFRLREPEKGYALGAPGFNDPKFSEGAVIDFFATAEAPDEELRKAAKMDGVGFEGGERSDYEIACAYAPGPPKPGMKPVPMDGSISNWSLCTLSTTSRGRITLSSSDPTADPLIDPAYFTTEHDLAVMRAGIRAILRMTESDAGKSFIISELPPDPSLAPLTSASTDVELDARIKAYPSSFYHLGGTAAMGKVVDSSCRVMGVQGLRVVDASVLPLSIGAHLQAPLYAVAERAAAMIIEGS